MSAREESDRLALDFGKLDGVRGCVPVVVQTRVDTASEPSSMTGVTVNEYSSPFARPSTM